MSAIGTYCYYMYYGGISLMIPIFKSYTFNPGFNQYIMWETEQGNIPNSITIFITSYTCWGLLWDVLESPGQAEGIIPGSCGQCGRHVNSGTSSGTAGCLLWMGWRNILTRLQHIDYHWLICADVGGLPYHRGNTLREWGMGRHFNHFPERCYHKSPFSQLCTWIYVKGVDKKSFKVKHPVLSVTI